MKSMTGYGKGIAEQDGRKVTIELKSVNHRYLDILPKLPRGYNFLEEHIRLPLKNALQRGHIDIYFSYNDSREGKSSIRIDSTMAKRYLDISQELSHLGLLNDLTVSSVIRMPEVLILEETKDDESILKELTIQATEQALSDLLQMREAEGKVLAKDILSKLDTMTELVEKIINKAPQVSNIYRENLKEKIQEILCEVDYDQVRLLNEVAYFAEKVSIDEELTRLKSHIMQGRRLLTQTQPVGRKFDFLVQELYREVNTIGSKTCDLYITEKVLELKYEIEKVKEQVQNVE